VSGYVAPAEPLQLIASPAIDKLFARKRGWFGRARVRKRLYAKGFPLPVERGRWLRSAVVAWIVAQGSVPGDQAPAPAKRRRRPAAASGYADT
jgi:hypothetical protein